MFVKAYYWSRTSSNGRTPNIYTLLHFSLSLGRTYCALKSSVWATTAKRQKYRTEQSVVKSIVVRKEKNTREEIKTGIKLSGI